MIRTILILFIAICSIAATAKFAPGLISDENDFLAQFIGVSYINFMGIILTITIASVSQLHHSLNEYEKQNAIKLDRKVRIEIFSAVRWLICIFVLSFAVVLLKPYFEGAGSETVFNGTALWCILLYLLILSDICNAVFSFEPSEDELKKRNPTVSEKP